MDKQHGWTLNIWKESIHLRYWADVAFYALICLGLLASLYLEQMEVTYMRYPQADRSTSAKDLYLFVIVFMGLGVTSVGNILNLILRICFVKKTTGHTNAKLTLGYHWLFDLLIFLVYGLTVYMFLWNVNFSFSGMDNNL
jgi:hypothetical protein